MSEFYGTRDDTESIATIHRALDTGLAREKGCTPAQLALAWVLAQGADIVPIPGTKRRKYLDENLGAPDVQLTAGDLQRIDAAFPKDAAAGTRYAASGMAVVHR